MKFENSFVVAAPPEEAWKVVLNVPEIAPCFPGASLTEQVDANTYKGQVAVKLGPVSLAFKGTAQITERDESARKASVKASGADTKGRGQAKAEATFVLEPDPKGTRVRIATDLSLTGAVAQYGRGAGIIQEIAAGLIEQFEQRLNGRLAAVAPTRPTASTGTAPADSIPKEAPGAASDRRDEMPATPAAGNAIGIGLLLRIFVRVLKQFIGLKA